MDTLEFVKLMERIKNDMDVALVHLKNHTMNAQMMKWELDGVMDKIHVQNGVLKEMEARQSVLKAKFEQMEEAAQKKCQELEELKRQELLEVRRKSADLDLLLNDAKKKEHLARNGR